ncbi:MAG: endonuclease/exonuclease/phosphatase family protein [Opitutales bacterium]
MTLDKFAAGPNECIRKSPRKRLRRAVWWLPLGLLWLGFTALFALSLIPYFGTFDWKLDLLSNFRMQYALAAVCGLLAAGLLRQRILAACFILGLLINLSEILRWPDTVTAAKEERVFKVIAFNLYSGNESLEAVLDWVQAQEPDIFIAIEYNSILARQLHALTDELGYERTFRFDHSTAIFSRLPLQVRANEPARGLVAVEIADPETRQNFLLTGIHLISPRQPRFWEHRNRQLEDLAQACASSDKPLLVMGDLNCSPYSPFFKKFVDASGLQPARGTWLPLVTWTRYSPLLFSSIDHVFISEGITTVRQATGPSLGSDHWPIVYEFVLR